MCCNGLSKVTAALPFWYFANRDHCDSRYMKPMSRRTVSFSVTGTSTHGTEKTTIKPSIAQNIKPQKHQLSTPPTRRARLLPGFLTIGLIISVPNWALCQQELHVVPSPFIDNSSLNGVSAITDNDMWAVGTIGAGRGPFQTLAEHFNGTSWSVISTPAVQGGQFAAVDGVASNDVWAVGQQAAGSSVTALIEHWNGTTWSVISSPRVGHGAFLSAVMAVSSNDVWAAGSNNSSGVLIEHWNGTSWSVIFSPAFTGVVGVRGISADASNDVWAVAVSTTLHWDGQSWSQIPEPSKFGGNAITALSPTNVWAAGSRSGEHPDALEAIAHWNGTSWNIVATVDPFPANHLSSRFTGIAAVSANNIWAVGSGFAEQWNGASWSLVNTPSGVGFSGMTALSGGLVVAVGDTCSTSCSAVILEN